MLFRKLWRTMGQYKAQFISMILMVILGIGVFAGFNMEWYSIEKDTGDFFTDSDFANYRVYSQDASGFALDDVQKIKEIDGVSDATRFISVNVEVDSLPLTSQNKKKGLSVAVSETGTVSHFVVISGEDYDLNSTDGIWLSDQFCSRNNLKLGDSIKLSYSTLSAEYKIKGLIKSAEYLVCVKDETQVMPDLENFSFAFISPIAYKNFSGAEYYTQINILSSLNKTDISKKIDEKLGKTMLTLSKEENSSYAASVSEADEGKTMGAIIPAIFLLIAVLTMVTTMHRLTAKEKTQIGTLKALGYKDKRIIFHYVSYALMIGVIGSVVGTILGYVIGGIIFSESGMMGTYFDMPSWKLYMPSMGWVVIIAVVAFLTLIGFLSVKKMLRGTAADALRPYTPKKMKSLLIEKAPVWKKLSFGTKWNLRDIMRHKARTGMSIVGVLGCMVILVGSLGMKDTMNSFLSTFYDDSMLYETRIYLADSATTDQREEVKSKYTCDTSGTISVELEGKAISLDVYDVENEMIKFPLKSKGFADINKENGAYICSRLSKEFNLKKGDTITVSPYGTDDKYSFKVLDVIRSITENVVISSTTAESVGLDYNIDSLYTNEKNITDMNYIKEIKDKATIIKTFDSFTSMLNSMVVILIVAGAVLGFIVLYNLGTMSYTERYREMATLKVVGFKNKDIAKLLISQNLWVTIVGIILGIPLGIGLLSYLCTALASEYEMAVSVSVLTCVISSLVAVVVSLLVGVFVAKKNKKIDMVEALKGAE